MAKVKVLLLLVLSLLILAMVAESRTIGNAAVAGSSSEKGEEEGNTVVVCNSVHGAEDGDTCSSVAQKVSLTTEEFLEINPNINCDTIFIGQWICVGGLTFS